MTDPFDALREPVAPVDPDPNFAAQLRRQLTDAVMKEGDVNMTTPTLSPYIVVSDARRAMDWYVEVFGARPRDEMYVNSEGTIGHAEVQLGNSVLMFAEASDLWPDVPVRAPEAPSTFSHTLHLDVDDVDGALERARAQGAAVEREPVDQPYGRSAVIVDPFGHRWMLMTSPT